MWPLLSFHYLRSTSWSTSTSKSLLPDEKHWTGAIPRYITILINEIVRDDQSFFYLNVCDIIRYVIEQQVGDQCAQWLLGFSLETHRNLLRGPF